VTAPADWSPYDPFVGLRPARSFVTDEPGGDRLRVAYFRRGDEPVLLGKAWFGPGAEGPPGIAHGGSVASVLDEALGAAAWMAGHRVLVARLIVDFRERVPLGLDATFEAQVISLRRALDGSSQCRSVRLQADPRLVRLQPDTTCESIVESAVASGKALPPTYGALVCRFRLRGHR
jgi:acyl-coenzyme A thioesterase PaaI-like protein